MTSVRRFTSADLELLPEDGKRYEIIDGELYMSRMPHIFHQMTCQEVAYALAAWDIDRVLGFVVPSPGLIFAEHDDVAPDLVWMSRERYRVIVEDDGKLHAAPELVVEVLSPGSRNAQRDREIKLGLYSRRGVREYWIVDWERRQIEVYRRENAALVLAGTPIEGDTLSSPLLPGFAAPVARLFKDIPRP